MSVATENPMRMTRTVDLCPSPHLSSEDLQSPDGKYFELDLTIKSFQRDEVGAEKELKGIIFFAERSRGLVVNRTNVKRLVLLHGNDLDALIGKRITIYVDPDVQYPTGQTGPGLRISTKAPAHASGKPRKSTDQPMEQEVSA